MKPAKILSETHEQALDRLAEEAESLGANAVVALRFTSSEIMQSAAEILVYGTAVVVEPVEPDQSVVLLNAQGGLGRGPRTRAPIWRD